MSPTLAHIETALTLRRLAIRGDALNSPHMPHTQTRLHPRPPTRRFSSASSVCLIACLVFNVARGADWPMLGRDETRNAVSPEKNPPLEWDVKNGKNIKWRAPIETWTASTPVVANGCVWIGTSDRERRDQKAVRAAGVLACHREGDGKPLYQHVSFVRTGPTARRIHFGLKASLLIEGDRLWYVNSGAETL